METTLNWKNVTSAIQVGKKGYDLEVNMKHVMTHPGISRNMKLET